MFVTKNLNCYKMANNGWISIVKVHRNIWIFYFKQSFQNFQERSLKTLKMHSDFSYLTLYDSPKRPIRKSERGPKAPSVGSLRVWGPEGCPSPPQEREGGCPNLLVNLNVSNSVIVPHQIILILQLIDYFNQITSAHE